MNYLHILRSTLLAALLGSAASSALAAAAVAVGDGNYTFTVTDDRNIEEAKASALEECAKRALNCRILSTRIAPGAIALAKGDDGMFASSSDTPEKARAKAMTDCRKNYRNCKFSALYWETGGYWAAWAYAKDQQGKLIANYFNYNADTEAEARAGALAGCIKQQDGELVQCQVQTRFGDWAFVRAGSASYVTVQLDSSMDTALADAMAACKAHSKPGDSCKVFEKAFNEGVRKAPASFDQLASLTDTARAAKAPARRVSTRAVQALSCTNRCVNGSCVRSFPDGRTEKWQAPRVFDPLNNDWKWDTSSCGG
jgi:hypothetical protein